MIIDVFAINKLGAVARIHWITTKIEELEQRIINVYKDISMAHFEAAEFALRASTTSNNKTNDLHSAISNLRNAYLIQKKLIHKKEKRFLFFEKPMLDDYQIAEVAYTCLNITLLIALLYKELDNEEPIEDWRKEAYLMVDEINTRIFKYRIDLYRDLVPINRKHVMNLINIFELKSNETHNVPRRGKGVAWYVRLTEDGYEKFKSLQKQTYQAVLDIFGDDKQLPIIDEENILQEKHPHYW